MAKAKKNKDIEQTIRETGKNIKKNVKRNWKKIAVITAIIILVVLIISFIAGLRIRFSLRDDLVINLEPADASFTITNNQDQTFDLSVSTDNSMFCKAECNYYFYDQSSETTIDSGKITLGKKDSFNKTYALEPPRKGSGQKIYSFDIKCNDINTFLCTTSGELRERSSFIVLNYLLSPSEQKIKDEVKTKLVQSFGLINNASKDLQKLEYIKNISSIKNNMPNNLSDELSSALTETDKIFKMVR